MKVKKTLEVNSEILLTEMMKFQKKKWENNRICSCDSDHPTECECDLSENQLRRWKKRVNRETSEKFGARAMQLLSMKTKRNMWRETDK